MQFLVHHKEDTEHIPVPAHAAPLLQQGALPALRELQLHVLVHTGILLHGSGSRRSERLRQQARGGAPASRRAPPGSTEQHLQLLERELQQAGVQGVGGLRHRRRLGFEPPPRPTYFEGCVRRCKFSGALWVQW